MISLASYSMLFLAWCITFGSLVYAWRRIAKLSDENARLIINLHDLLRAAQKEEKKEGS